MKRDKVYSIRELIARLQDYLDSGFRTLMEEEVLEDVLEIPKKKKEER